MPADVPDHWLVYFATADLDPLPDAPTAVNNTTETTDPTRRNLADLTSASSCRGLQPPVRLHPLPQLLESLGRNYPPELRLADQEALERCRIVDLEI